MQPFYFNEFSSNWLFREHNIFLRINYLLIYKPFLVIFFRICSSRRLAHSNCTQYSLNRVIIYKRSDYRSPQITRPAFSSINNINNVKRRNCSTIRPYCWEIQNTRARSTARTCAGFVSFSSLPVRAVLSRIQNGMMFDFLIVLEFKCYELDLFRKKKNLLDGPHSASG